MRKSVYTKEYQALVEKLRKARLEANITQVEAARRLHKPQSFISKCESGERRVDPIELQAFAKLYKKSRDYFYY